MRYLLMPGLDGTGDLFGPFCAALPASASVSIVRYPAELIRSCDELTRHVQFPDEPFIVVAESFSGPAAIMLAAQHPPKMIGLALVATFARWPSLVPRTWVPVLAAILSRGAPPAWAVRHLLVGRDASDECVAEFQAAVVSVRRDVLVSRLLALASCDVREALARCALPTAILAGQRDRLIRRRVADEMRSLLVNSEVAMIDGPHLLLQTRPEACVAAIHRFLLRDSNRS